MAAARAAVTAAAAARGLGVGLGGAGGSAPVDTHEQFLLGGLMSVRTHQSV
jgi:hypothetical protein